MALRFKSYGLRGDADGLLRQEFENTDATKQGVAHKYLDRAPNVREVGEKELIFALVSGAVRLYTKINGVLKYVQFT